MDHDEMIAVIHEMIAVIQAHKEGKKIEWRAAGGNERDWTDEWPPAWNFAFFVYRIKPSKPREWALVPFNKHTTINGKAEQLFALRPVDELKSWNGVIHAREVLEAPSVEPKVARADSASE